MSELFHFKFELIAERNNISYSELAGKNVTVTITSSNGDERYFNGIIVELSPGRISEKGGYSAYTAVMRPAVWTLTHCYDHRIFQNKTVPEIIAQVLDSGELKKKQVTQVIENQIDLSGYQPREYCVQYNESDFDFIARLCEEEGIYYFFRHLDGQHTMVFGDKPSQHPPLVRNIGHFNDPRSPKTVLYQRTLGSLLDQEVIKELSQGNMMASAIYAAQDFNFTIPNTDLSVEKTSTQDSAHNVGERYEYPGWYKKTMSRGQDLAAIRMEERDAQVRPLKGHSDCRLLAPGFRYTLEEYPIKALNGKDYLVTWVYHFASQSFGTNSGGDHYRNQFSCMAHETPFRPPRTTLKPVISGVQTAIVTGPPGEEIHTDNHGRVKVQFHWDRLGKKDDQSSCWIRVSQAWAGGKWGTMHIPRVGQEVIIDFLEGNPDRPIITGRVYNGHNQVPYSLPAEKSKSTIISSSTPGNRGYNELRFEDKAGSEEIYLHGQKDWNIEIKNDKNQHVGHDETHKVDNNRSKTVGVDQKESIGNNKTITVGTNHTESIGNNMDIKVGTNLNEKIGSDMSLKVGSNQSTKVGSNQSVKVGKNQTTTVSIASAETIGAAKALTVGGAYQISVGALMNTTVGLSQSEQVMMNKSVDVGKKTDITSGEEITITCGKSKLTMKKDGNIILEGVKIFVKGETNIKMQAKKILQN